MALIELAGIRKVYDLGEVQVEALRGVSLSIERGEFVSIMGPSGSGKSTLMNIIGCLDVPTEGTYRLDGADVSSLERDELAVIRNRQIGFVFQGFNLLRRTSALENVELPLLYKGVSRHDRRALAASALERVGLKGREHHQPHQLSDGQQQRVAIARALVNESPLILADEPTGNLDTRTSVEIMEFLTELNRDSGITVVLVTHEPDIALYSRRVVTVRDGLVVSDRHPAEGGATA